MQIGAFQKEYKKRADTLKNLESLALFTLDQAIKRRKVKVHSLTSRIKDLDSLLDKARARSIEAPFAEIYDILGLRVVCLFRSDIEVLTHIIRATFEIVEEENKEDQAASDVFGYMGRHFVVTLRGDSSTRSDVDLMDMRFEIQIRTVGQHVWASLSHHLDYKSEATVPSDLRRDFYALSGLFYVADTQFELLRTQQSEYRALPATGDRQEPKEHSQEEFLISATTTNEFTSSYRDTRRWLSRGLRGRGGPARSR